jgi:cytochrome P450
MVSLGIVRRIARADLRTLRGPAGHPLWGHLPAIIADGPGFMVDCARGYGDIVPLRLINVRALLLNNPDHIEEALVARHDALAKPPIFRRNRSVFGRGLFTSEGEQWRRQRRLAQPAFTRSALTAYAPVMVAAARRALSSWREGVTYDIHREMINVTLATVGESLFGVGVYEELDRISVAVAQLIAASAERLNTYFAIPEWVPTPANRRVRRGSRELAGVVQRILAARLAEGSDRDDLLGRYLRARATEGGWLSDDLLRDELITFLLAGHESVALTLTWAWYLLARHPTAEAAFHAELEEVLNGREPGAGDLPRLRYTEAVIQESLRLYPPIWLFARVATRTTTIGGYRVPRGRRIVVSPWALQRDPRFFADPERFDPDRWLTDRPPRPPKYAFPPFGGGPRSCVGAGFAMMEGVLLLATIGQRVRFLPVPDHPVTLQPAVTLRPRNGIKATLERR